MSEFWQKVITATQHAIKTGALHSIPTECELIQQNDVQFILRVLANLERKDKAKKQQKKKQKENGNNFNPFLPYEEDLFVTNLSDSHVCLLNKFNVVDHHLLLITREFEEQESLLTLEDFTAMWQVLREIDGLGFYNGGKLAGASQPHKHLQVAPFPLAPNISKTPLENLILSAKTLNKIVISPILSFGHAIAFFDSFSDKLPLENAKITLDYYYQMLETLGLKSNDKKQSGAYNLLITREWMLIVARELETFKSISINSLGFAGALLVKNEEQRQLILEYKPMNILAEVAKKIN